MNDMQKAVHREKVYKKALQNVSKQNSVAKEESFESSKSNTTTNFDTIAPMVKLQALIIENMNDGDDCSKLFLRT